MSGAGASHVRCLRPLPRPAGPRAEQAATWRAACREIHPPGPPGGGARQRNARRPGWAAAGQPGCRWA